MSQFLFGFTCEKVNRWMSVGCDSRITMKLPKPVTWRSRCVCGNPVTVTKFGGIYRIRHPEEEADNVISLNNYRNSKVITIGKNNGKA